MTTLFNVIKSSLNYITISIDIYVEFHTHTLSFDSSEAHLSQLKAHFTPTIYTFILINPVFPKYSVRRLIGSLWANIKVITITE